MPVELTRLHVWAFIVITYPIILHFIPRSRLQEVQLRSIPLWLLPHLRPPHNYSLISWRKFFTRICARLPSPRCISEAMPERRNLRSNKETSSANNGRIVTSKGKAILSKKGNTSGSAKEESGDQPQTTGTESIENGVNGSEDVEMDDDGPERVSVGTANEGDEEMTVVVPPPKSSKLNREPGKDSQGDTTMEGSEKTTVDTECRCSQVSTSLSRP